MTVKVTVKDVYNRDLSLRSHTPANVMKSALYENAIETTSLQIIENAINNWRSLDANELVAMEKAIDLFEHATEFASAGTLNKLATQIAESSISKVRDGSQTAAYIKRKLSRFKTKLHTKTSKRIKQAAEIKLPKPELPNPAGGGSKATDKQVEEAYNIMLDKALIIEQCDRVIRNDKRLSKRFNLDNVAYKAESVEDFVFETCSLLDTYTIPYYAKYSLALENCMYTLYRNQIPFDTQDIVEAATTYFLMKDIDKNYISGIAKVLVENKMITEADLTAVDYVLNPNSQILAESMDNILDSISYSSSMSNSLLEFSAVDYRSVLESKAKKNEVKDLLDNFKLLPKKSVEEFKKLIPKIFSKSENEIIDEIPGFFTILRTFFVISSFAINPVIGLLTAFTNHLLGMHFDRQQIPKVLEKYKKEISKVEDKIDKASGEKKERLEKYHHELEFGQKKLQEYYDAIRTEKEKDDEFNAQYEEDEEYNFDESVKSLAVDLETLVSLIESIDLSVFENCKFDTRKCVAMDITALDSLAICTSKLIPDEAIRKCMSESFNEEYHKIKSSKTPDRYIYTEYARIARDLFNENSLLEASDDLTYNLNYLASLYDVCNAVSVLGETTVSYIVEDTSMTNKLKMAGEKLKKTAQNLSDKDKMMSKQIDGSMASLERSIEKALTTDNREAVIKGKIIPSASKCVKLAITTGAAWLVNPAIAVIGVIGHFAMSKKLQKKERQLLLDEINIELEMCEKYLKMAEEKDDMQATRELLMIQKRLQREKARIVHSAKYKYNTGIDTSTKDRD